MRYFCLSIFLFNLIYQHAYSSTARGKYVIEECPDDVLLKRPFQ
jgi:hypothetical protein